MNEILGILKTGKVPTVPVVVTVEEKSIQKIAFYIIAVAIVIIIITHLSKKF